MTRAWSLLSAVVLLGSAGGALAQAVLQPHIASYRLDLDHRHGASSLVAASGGLVIEWRLECEGWISRQRMGLVSTTDAGDTIRQDVRFASWEALDGSELRYAVRSFENDQRSQEFRGVAEVAQGQGGVAHFTLPHKAAVALPPGTVFPTEHIRLVLDAAASGAQIVSHEVFDGFGFDALTQITSVIGGAQPLAAGPEGTAEKSGSAWPLSMAYYNVEEGEQMPEFEATFLLDDRGVLHGLGLDYGDFRLQGTMEQLELLDRPKC